MTKKSHKWIEEDYEDEITDKRVKKKFADRRKKKRLKNALRNLDVDQLQDLEEYDYERY